MAKVALLIGVSEYGSGLNPLPGMVKNVEAVQQVLQPLEMGGFDEVKRLLNPNPPVMRNAIETLFLGRTNNDVVLLFFSGHLIQDDSGKLFLSTSITSKSPKPELIRLTAIPTNFVDDLMSNSACQRQVVILDCSVSPVSVEEITATNNGTVDIKTQLGSKGRAILSCFTSTQNSFKPPISDPSVYTRYFVEGITTGAADLDNDGWISVDELHEYVSKKVQVAAPAIKPEFYPLEDGYKILLAKAPIDDPKLKYRKAAESWVSCGEISEAGRYILDKLAESLDIPSGDRTGIEAELLKPYQEYQKNLQQYKREFAKAISNDYPLDTQERQTLRGVQQYLGLRDEDVAPLEERMAGKLADLSQPESDARKLTQSEKKSEPNSVPSTPDAVLLESTPTPALAPTNLTPASDDEVNELAHSEGESEPNSVPSMLSAVLPESISIPALAPTNPTPAVNLSSDLVGSPTSPGSVSVSTFPKKFLLPLGIGGVLATLALVVGIFSRASVAPPPVPVNRVSSSPSLSPKPSPTVTNSDKKPSPSPSTPPESKVCTIFVNGNLRSEPTAFRDNVVEALRKPLAVTGKQTEGGWVEVKLPDNELAWAYLDIISSKDREEMNTCLSRQGIPIKTIEDIPPPP